MSVTKRLTWLLVLAALTACRAPTEETEPALETVLAGQPADLDELDPPVRAQFRRLQEAALAAYDDPAAAAEAVGRLGMWYQVYYAWDPETAFRLYREAARLNPNDPRWPYYTGFTALKLGRLAEARTAFQRVLQLDPDDVAALVHLAEIDLQERRTEAARERLERAQRLQPGSARILGGLGDAAFQAGEYARAIDYLEQALEIFPEAPQLTYKLALAHQRSGNRETAKELFESTPQSQAVLDLALNNPYQRALMDMNVGSVARVSSARQAMASGDTDAAIRLAREAVEIAANRKTPLINLASVYLRSGRFNEAIATVDTIEAEFGPLSAAVILRALAREQKGELARAMDDYRTVIAADPGNLQALIGAGEIARRQGDLDAALDFYHQAVQRNPDQVAPRLLRIRALWHLHRMDELRRVLAEDVALHPDSTWLIGLHGRVDVTGTDPERIRRGLNMSIAAYRRQPSVFSAQSIAMGLAGLGRFDDAATWQQLAAATLFSSASPALYQLAVRRLERIQAGRTGWPAALDDFDTLNVPLDNPPPPPRV